MQCPFCQNTMRVQDSRPGTATELRRKELIAAQVEINTLLQKNGLQGAPYKMRLQLCPSCDEDVVTVEMDLGTLRELTEPDE